ncbi:MAG: hypothetical protein [Bacteriophage sp.]|nr:MAG: hypothetical protein [Bacteriophage sp.]
MKPFVTLDIETLGTPGVSNYIAMPSFAFVVLEDIDKHPTIIRGLLNQEKQIAKGALTTGSTIKFWMEMALAGSATCKQIMDNKCEFMMYNSKSDNYLIQDRHSCDHDVFRKVRKVFSSLNLDRDIMFYGNGPEFDMSIYSAHLAMEDLYEPPYKYWLLGNVRALREEYMNNDKDFKALEQESHSYAFNTIKELNMISVGVIPAKHDPVFDALAEAYQIWAIKEFLKK